jgi:hypothetical protein
MCPTFLRSVRPGFGTSDDPLSVYDRSNARSGSQLGDSRWFAVGVAGVVSRKGSLR